MAIDPRNAYAYYNRGISHDRSSDYDAAISGARQREAGLPWGSPYHPSPPPPDFTRAITLLPSNADFYHNRGFCYRKQGCFDAAIAGAAQGRG